MEPKETNVLKVRGYLATLKKGEFIPAGPIIAQKTGLKPKEVWNALGFLREDGELAHPTTEETRLRRSQAMRYLKNKWIHAEAYAKIFMSPSEARFALLFEQGKDLSLNTLNNMFSRFRREAGKRQEVGDWQEGDLRDLTPEERTDIKKHSHRYTPQGAVEQRVHVWVNCFRTVELQRLPLPSGRLEWMEIVDHVQAQKDLPLDELGRWKMLLVDWMEEVDFHQIGSRRFANSRYIAGMLARHSRYLLDKVGTIENEEEFRRGLQIPGASLPKDLFTRIKRFGQVTDEFLEREEERAFGLSVDVRRMIDQMTPTDYLKFETYYYIYLVRFPAISTLSLDNPTVLKSHIRRLLQDSQTLGSIRNWGRVHGQIRDQVGG